MVSTTRPSIWNGIRDFSNISPTAILQGMSVLAAALRTTQVSGNPPLPFIQESLTDLFSFAQPVAEFIEEMGAAAIVCGPTEDDPPRGNLLAVAPGEPVFCQAIALEDPAPNSVTWEVRTDTGFAACGVTNGEDTVGPNPVNNAVCTAPGGGAPDIRVSFTDSTGPRTVSRRFLSAQEMAEKLIELVGFDSLSDLIGYDPDNNVLTFHLRKTFDPPARSGLNLDFGDQLKGETNLAGLGATAGASVEIDASGATVDFIFGVELADFPDPGFMDPDPGDADPVTPDRFFIRSSGQPLLRLDDLSAVVDVALAGRIGFLEVEAVEDASGFSLGKAGAGPILAADINYGARGRSAGPGPRGLPLQHHPFSPTSAPAPAHRAQLQSGDAGGPGSGRHRRWRGVGPRRSRPCLGDR